MGSQMLVTIAAKGRNRSHYLEKRLSIALQTRECLVPTGYAEFINNGLMLLTEQPRVFRQPLGADERLAK